MTNGVKLDRVVSEAAYEFALARLSGPKGKAECGAVAMALAGLPGQDFIAVCQEWFELTGLRTLKLPAVGEICGWLRAYELKYIFRGMRLAVERAPGLGHTVTSPVYCTPAIQQLANSPVEKDLRAGRGQR